MAASRGAGARVCWTTRVWRLLCLLASMSALAAVTGVLWTWPPLVQGMTVLPGLVVTLLIAVASWADSKRSRCPSTRR